MLTLYLSALVIGGTMVAASLLFGGGDHELEAHVDAELEVDAHADGDIHHADVGGSDVLDAWLPLTSLRFWTFFLAFFGLSGTLLQGLALIDSAAIVGVVSGAIGWLSGTSMVTVYRRLQGDVVDSTLSIGDYVGATGTVVLPIERGRTGKVRLQLKGRTVEVMAETEDDDSFAQQQSVLVLEVNDDGRVLVTRPHELQA